MTASDEGGGPPEAESSCSAAQEAESADGGKASSTSACVLDLTNPPADSSSGGSEAGSEVTSSSSAVKAGGAATAARQSPPAVDSALNLTVSPQERGARPGRVEQTMPEDLSSYAEPQDLSTSNAGEGKRRRPPEMPIDLTVRLAPPNLPDAGLTEGDAAPPPPQAAETAPSPGSQSHISSEGLQAADSETTVKDTLLSPISDSNPSASNLSGEGEGVEAGPPEPGPSVMVVDPFPPEPGLDPSPPEPGLDPQGDLMDWFRAAAAVDCQELEDVDMEDCGDSASLPAAPDADESGGTADSTFTPAD